MIHSNIRKPIANALRIVSIICALLLSASMLQAAGLERVSYNNPGLTTDLGVGLWAWPLPVDYDDDGDYDLLVSCPDKPYNGTYFFENPGGKKPVFRPGVRIGNGYKNITPSYIDGKTRLLLPGREFDGFRKGEKLGDKFLKIYPKENLVEKADSIRANQWSYCDYEGDGDLDLIVGVGLWGDYGWDNAFNEKGEWTRGPLHGNIFLLRNNGTTDKPDYAEPEMLKAGEKTIDVYGEPSPNFADFDGDGDLDLICGEFIDKITYFRNVGTRTQPRYEAGRQLPCGDDILRMDLCMIVVVALDWNRDGDVDLIIGQEDGRVACAENTGRVVDGLPVFSPPGFFQQEAADLKFGALVTPFSVDWDGDGDEDLICGNTAGYVGFIENLDGKNPPKWAKPRYLEADGKVIRIMAGPNGSIQGPAEEQWGYTTLNVADWDNDGLLDIMLNSIWGKVVWYRNVGSAKQPRLAEARPVEVNWKSKPPKPAWNWWNPEEKELATQWRTTPVVIDWNRDGLNDLVMLDHEGYLAFFQRTKINGALSLLPGKRIFADANTTTSNQAKPTLLRLNAKEAGGSGRRKLCFVDWDLDGRLDLMVNSKNVSFLRNVGNKNGVTLFADMGMVDSRILAGHTTSPSIVDWDKNGIPDLLVGAEDGFFYYMKNPYADIPRATIPRVLIIGDSISLGYTPHVRTLLEGKANITHNKGNAEHTGTGLARLDAWLGETQWDVIHFNWGLWDLCYRHPDSKEQGHRDKINGEITFTPQQYEKNLRELVNRLKKTGAKLIWATTTPVPANEAGRVLGDELKYNAIAEHIMKENNIPINNLHSHALKHLPGIMLQPGNVHYTGEGYAWLAEKVAAEILKITETK